MNYRKLIFDQKGDDRGHLVVVEGFKDIPFDIKRIFYIYGSNHDVVRGQHANRNSEFVFINVSGKSKIKVDDGHQTEIIELNEAHTGLYLGKMMWKEMYDFTPDSVLLVLTNTEYDNQEYIRDYNKYLKEVNKNA